MDTTSRLDVLGQPPIEDSGDVDEWALREGLKLTPEERFVNHANMMEFARELRRAGGKFYGKDAVASEETDGEACPTAG